MPVAIVTGATRGIGRAIAGSLADLGWDLGLIATSRPALEEAAGDIAKATGVRVASATADVGEWEDVSQAVQDIVGRLGSPSLLVNNAGRIDAEVPVWESDPGALSSVVLTNVLGTLLMERAVLPHMVAGGGGRVINLVSGAGARSWGVAPAYTAAKAGQLRNVGDLDRAGKSSGIKAFGIAPGVVLTDMTGGMQAHRDRVEYTPVEATCDLVQAVASGRLDDWSGCYLRADVDTPDSLEVKAASKPEGARRFGVQTWGEDDPLGH